MIGIDLLLNYSRVKWRRNLLGLETLASLLQQTLFPTVLSDLHHGILSAPATFIGVHGDLVAVPPNLGPGVGGRSIRHRVGFGFGFGFEMATEWMKVKRVWGLYCLLLKRARLYKRQDVTRIFHKKTLRPCFSIEKTRQRRMHVPRKFGSIQFWKQRKKMCYISLFI